MIREKFHICTRCPPVNRTKKRRKCIWNSPLYWRSDNALLVVGKPVEVWRHARIATRRKREINLINFIDVIHRCG